jgi:hypothetical protein
MHFLVDIFWVRRAGCGPSHRSLPQMIAGLLQVCYMVSNPLMSWLRAAAESSPAHFLGE